MNKLCYKCDLCMRRHNIVYGAGNTKSYVMLIGEAPGYKEDKEGIPFIGKSGQFLRKVLHQFGYDDIYITNVVKCRPPGNATPTTREIEICTKYFLIKELRYIRPKFIITAGLTASNFFFKESKSMRELNSNIYDFTNYFILPVYHPSYIITNDMEELFIKRFEELDIFITKNINK